MSHSHLLVYFYSHQERRLYTPAELALIEAVCEELYLIFAVRFDLWHGARIFSVEQEHGALRENLGYSMEELKMRALEKQVPAGVSMQDNTITYM